MAPRKALQVILLISVFGVLFSGTLTYNELFGNVGRCPSPGAPGTVFGYPACVYGFFMYLALTVISALGLRGTFKADGRSDGRAAGEVVAHHAA